LFVAGGFPVFNSRYLGTPPLYIPCLGFDPSHLGVRHGRSPYQVSRSELLIFALRFPRASLDCISGLSNVSTVTRAFLKSCRIRFRHPSSHKATKGSSHGLGDRYGKDCKEVWSSLLRQGGQGVPWSWPGNSRRRPVSRCTQIGSSALRMRSRYRALTGIASDVRAARAPDRAPENRFPAVTLYLTCRPRFVCFQQLACCTKPVDTAFNL
jgi:hypothetical protein